MSELRDLLMAIIEGQERIERRLDELALSPPPKPDGGWLTSRELAERRGVKPQWVRDHAAELGGEQLGNGPQGRWRFPPSAAEPGGQVPELPKPSPPPPRKRLRRPSGVPLLPIRGKAAP